MAGALDKHEEIYTPNQREKELLKETFITFQDAVKEFGENGIKEIFVHLYTQVSKDLDNHIEGRKNLNEEDIQSIAEKLAALCVKFADKTADLDNYQALHDEYNSHIQIPFNLPPIMKAAREARAEAIADEIADHLDDSVNRGSTILDFGSGGGRPALALAQKTGRTIVAADVADFRVDEVKEQPDAVVFAKISEGKILDKNQQILPENSIGDAFVSYAFHHADPQDIQEEFNELHRVIKPGGKLVVLETAIANIGEYAQKNAVVEGYLDKASFLKAQLLDFITSNFFREEPVMMPVPGSYHENDKWNNHAEKAGFTLISSSDSLTVDDFGEACQYMVYQKPNFTEMLTQQREQGLSYARSC